MLTVQKQTPYWLFAGFWICILIAIAVVIRRLVALAHHPSSGPPQLVALDQSFSSHAALTIAHIVPALGFVLVTPFALLRRFAALSWPRKLLYPLGIIVGATAYAMATNAIGGWTERSAVLFFNTLFLYSMVRAWRYEMKGQEALMRRWLMRAIAVLLGIATTRPVMGLFFATSNATHLAPQNFFGIAFWIGFSINWIIVESWFRAGSPRPLPQQTPQPTENKRHG